MSAKEIQAPYWIKYEWDNFDTAQDLVDTANLSYPDWRLAAVSEEGGKYKGFFVRDARPWHKFPDEVPFRSGSYIVFVDEDDGEWFGCEIFDWQADIQAFCYIDAKGVHNINSAVKAWMEIPTPPTF